MSRRVGAQEGSSTDECFRHEESSNSSGFEAGTSQNAALPSHAQGTKMHLQPRVSSVHKFPAVHGNIIEQQTLESDVDVSGCAEHDEQCDFCKFWFLFSQTARIKKNPLTWMCLLGQSQTCT